MKEDKGFSALETQPPSVDASAPPERRVIWKFGIPILDTVALMLPEGAQILSVQTQHDELQLWALVDPNAATDKMRRVHIIGTGNQVAGPLGRFINTFQMADGALIWHAFEAFSDGVLAPLAAPDETQRMKNQ